MLKYLVLTAFASLTLAAPNVTLGNITVTGVENGTLHKFLGIPYALPPYALIFSLATRILTFDCT